MGSVANWPTSSLLVEFPGFAMRNWRAPSEMTETYQRMKADRSKLFRSSAKNGLVCKRIFRSRTQVGNINFRKAL